MSLDIAKLCVESLRVYAREELGFKLKAAHAHEIVAAFFGYKSRIALLSDAAYPLSKLQDADYIVLDPPIALVNQRRQNLEGLSSELPASHLLAEKVYPTLISQKWALEKTWPDLGALAKYLAEEQLLRHMTILGADLSAINWDIDVTVQLSPSEAVAKVSINYRTSEAELQRDSSYIIRFPRIAANLGYGKPLIEETRYTGEYRKICTAENKAV